MNISYKFDKNKKLTNTQKQELLDCAVAYLDEFEIIDLEKLDSCISSFLPNLIPENYIIRIDATKRILGFKRTKTYYIDLLENFVEEVVPGKGGGKYTYLVKQLVLKPVSFLGYVSKHGSNPELMGIQVEEYKPKFRQSEVQ